jgi:hypothetical protein
MRRFWRIWVVWCVALVALLGCSDDDGDGGGADGVATFRFSIRHDPTGAEDFIAETSDLVVIDSCRAQLALPAENRLVHVHGPIARAEAGENLSWSWRFVPDKWHLAPFSMELCDGNPSGVESDVGYWVDTIGVFCPWNSYVAEEMP